MPAVILQVTNFIVRFSLILTHSFQSKVERLIVHRVVIKRLSPAAVY